jgi:hypothetical protein
MGADLSIAWPSLSNEHYDLTNSLLSEETIFEIFENGQPFIGRNDIPVVSHDSLANKRVLCLHGALNELNGKTREEIEAFSAQFDVMLYDLPFPVVMAGSSEAQEAEIAKQKWPTLNIAGSVRVAYEQLALDNGLAEGVAVHMRRGDMIPMLHNATLRDLRDWGATQIFQRYIPVKSVINLVGGRFQSAASIAICSEDTSIVDTIGTQFPDRNVFSSRGIFPVDGNQAALLDLMLLAGAKHLISPFKSYFSECANTIGRCELINSGLDIPNLVNELVATLDQTDLPDRDARKAIIYLVGYKNLWYDPESAYRAELLEKARAADRKIADEMLAE